MPKNPVQAEQRHVGALNRSHILPERAAIERWSVTPPAGTLPVDLCRPEYWKHVATDVGIKPNHLVNATCADGTWYATYLVVHVGPQHAKLQLLHEYSLVEVSDLQKSGEEYEPAWKGPAHKWIVRRIADGETMKHGFESNAAAAAWIARELKNIAA